MDVYDIVCTVGMHGMALHFRGWVSRFGMN